MSDQEAEAPVVPLEREHKKAKSRPKKSQKKSSSRASRTLPKKVKATGVHVGHIARISINTGGSTESFAMIELHGKKGTSLSFGLKSADPVRAAAIVGLATSALVSGYKVHIRSVADDDGALSVGEIEVRSKR